MTREELDKMNRKNISSIETFFDSLLRDKLTKNLFFSELPTVVKQDWKEMVVVDIGNEMLDYDAYGKCTVLISLYAKMNPYGKKDVKVMQKLESKLNELIATNEHPYYHISRRGSYSNYGTVNDTFINIVQINLLIT